MWHHRPRPASRRDVGPSQVNVYFPHGAHSSRHLDGTAVDPGAPGSGRNDAPAGRSAHGSSGEAVPEQAAQPVVGRQRSRCGRRAGSAVSYDGRIVVSGADRPASKGRWCSAGQESASPATTRNRTSRSGRPAPDPPRTASRWRRRPPGTESGSPPGGPPTRPPRRAPVPREEATMAGYASPPHHPPETASQANQAAERTRPSSSSGSARRERWGTSPRPP